MMLISSEVLNVANINWYNCFAGIVVGLFAFKGVVSLKDWIIDKFGITTKRAIAVQNEQDAIANHEASLNSIVATNEVIVSEIGKLSEKIENVEGHMHSIDEKVSKIEKQSNANNEANIMQLYDDLDRKARYYIETLHGIPENEFQGFCDMFEIYTSIGGNHGMEKKFKYCVDNLPIIPSTLFVMRTDNLLSDTNK